MLASAVRASAVPTTGLLDRFAGAEPDRVECADAIAGGPAEPPPPDLG
jgi:hypothetical protein